MAERWKGAGRVMALELQLVDEWQGDEIYAAGRRQRSDR